MNINNVIGKGNMVVRLSDLLADLLEVDKTYIGILSRMTITEASALLGKSKQALSDKILKTMKKSFPIKIEELLADKEYIIVENDVFLSKKFMFPDMPDLFSFTVGKYSKRYLIVFRNKEDLEKFKEYYNSLDIQEFSIPFNVDEYEKDEIKRLAVVIYLENFQPIKSLSGVYMYFTGLSFNENIEMFLKNSSKKMAGLYFRNFKSARHFYNNLGKVVSKRKKKKKNSS